jgi:predicted RNA-binding Zn ribbon-like protein
MRLSEKYPVPREFALLYEFVNSLDLRRYVEQGTAHVTGDELATALQMERWMRVRGLLGSRSTITEAQYRKALELRDALRAFLRAASGERLGNREIVGRLNELCEGYPMVLKIGGDKTTLQPAKGSSGLGRILSELYLMAATGRLDRVKSCESDECHWIFYDHSKPGKRRWCSSALCGNRQKTRAYRERRKQAIG